MINYILDPTETDRNKVTTFPYKMKSAIVIVSKNGRYFRFPGWGTGKEVIKVDENYVYVKSDIKGKVNLFNAHGDKVKEILEDELK